MARKRQQVGRGVVGQLLADLEVVGVLERLQGHRGQGRVALGDAGALPDDGRGHEPGGLGDDQVLARRGRHDGGAGLHQRRRLHQVLDDGGVDVGRERLGGRAS